MSAIVNGNSKYAKKYIKGEQIFANKNTLGIMTFEIKKEAERWSRGNPFWWDDKYRDLIILRVIPIGRGKRVYSVCKGISTNELDRYYNKLSFHSISSPINTMAYPGVLVVD